MAHPVQEGGSTWLVGAGHESEEVETPAFGPGVVGIPHIENESGAKTFDGGSAREERVKMFGIKLRGAVEPGLRPVRQTRKSEDQDKDLLVRCRLSFGGKS